MNPRDKHTKKCRHSNNAEKKKKKEKKTEGM